MPLRSHKQKRMRQIKKLMQRGLLDPEKEDPFSLFVASTNIRYCFYHETHKILGQTFGMCVLQVRQHSPIMRLCNTTVQCAAHARVCAGLLDAFWPLPPRQ
jgi:tRNA(Met) C34 N-acetyltransferase TmcA